MSKIDTLCVHAGYEPKRGEPRQMPIVQSTTFKYETSDQMGRLFDLEDSGYFYTRLANPTCDMVAARINALEGGVGAILTSSGQAANLFVDHNATDEEVEACFRPETKLVFGETLSNPGVEVLDIERFAKIAHAHGVPLVIDNTFATPVHCRPFEWGADIVTHSTTKYIDGHGASVGGCLVDSGNFDWEAHADKFPGLTTPDASYHGLTYTKKFGKAAYITKAVTHLMRDLGSMQSPQNAFYLNLGLQTLHLRIRRVTESALKVATFLKNHPAVAWIRYPDLPDDPEHAKQLKYLPEGSCGVMCIGLKGGRDFDNRFMDALKLITIETHVADCYSCILHPASHTHRQLSDEQLRAAGIDPGLMRVSIGLEDPDDIIADLSNALDIAANG